MMIKDGKIEFDNDHEKEMMANDYYIFEKTERGKKWIEDYKLALLDPNDFVRSSYNEYQAGYANGIDDFIRKILKHIDAYKIWLGQESKNNE